MNNFTLNFCSDSFTEMYCCDNVFSMLLRLVFWTHKELWSFQSHISSKYTSVWWSDHIFSVVLPTFCISACTSKHRITPVMEAILSHLMQYVWLKLLLPLRNLECHKGQTTQIVHTKHNCFKSDMSILSWYAVNTFDSWYRVWPSPSAASPAPFSPKMNWLSDGLHYCTFSLGRRLMVLSGRRTRRTLRDLIVLMSLPVVPLCRLRVKLSLVELVWAIIMKNPTHPPVTQADCSTVNQVYTVWGIPVYILLVKYMHVMCYSAETCYRRGSLFW